MYKYCKTYMNSMIFLNSYVYKTEEKVMLLVNIIFVIVMIDLVYVVVVA